MTVTIHNDPDNLPEQHKAGHLQLRAGQSAWTDDQHAALKQIGLADASEADLKVFLHQAQRTGLDPFARQIYMIARYDSQSGGNKYTIQAGIDGLRLIANRHPQYAGQTEPEWCGEDGQWRDVWLSRKAPVAARVKVVRRDWDLPAAGVAIFSEFAQTKKGGDLTQMWATKGAHMIAKCAEAAALRKAFPHELSGLYTDDELGPDEHTPRRRAVIDHVSTAPVTGEELRGSTPATEPVNEPPTDAPSEGSSDRMSSPQQRKLFALLRESDIDDRHDWAAGLLGRDITSFGQLSQGDAARLIDNLEPGAAS